MNSKKVGGMLRKIVGIVTGLVVGMIGMMLLHMLSMIIYPLPDGVDVNDPESLGQYIPNMPLGAFIMVWMAHGGGAFIASATCTAIAGSRWYIGAGILGVLFTLAGIANLLMLPHPLWFAAVDLLAYLPLALLACYLVGGLFERKSLQTCETGNDAA